MLDNWQRIEKIVDWTGLSVNGFAMRIGLKRAENLYQIKKGNNGISKDLASLIASRYPSVNRGWLLTGEGEPFLNDMPSYTPTAFRAFADCEVTAIPQGTAMEPRIPAQANVLVRRSSVKHILPGNIYLIISPRFSGIRVVRRSPEKPEELRLVPWNREDYDEVILSANEVESVWAVAGYLMGL